MTIEVTQEDIDNGAEPEAWCATCPVARALSRAYGERWHAGIQTARRISDNTIIAFPPKVVKFIDDFDREEPVKPFTFELNYDPTN